MISEIPKVKEESHSKLRLSVEVSIVQSRQVSEVRKKKAFEFWLGPLGFDSPNKAQRHALP